MGGRLGLGVSHIVNAFNHAMVILGNTLAKADHRILNPLRKVLSTLWLPPELTQARIVPSELGADARAAGSASLAIEDALSARPGRKGSRKEGTMP